MSNVQRRSNTQRRSVARAAKSLEHYDDREVKSNVIDLLTDLRHFADFYGFNMHELLDTSHVHYADELSDARVTNQ